MLNLMPRALRHCEGMTRRNLLQVGALSGLGLTLPQFLAAQAHAGSAHPAGTTAAGSPAAVNCIMIWTQGGTSHHDTFDPKPLAPVSVKGEFNAISTSVPGVQFAEIVPGMAKEAHRFGLLRSWNPKNGSHSIADQYVLSGRPFNPAVHYPTVGSVVSQQFGFKTAMPPFIQLGNNLSTQFGGGAPGILGLEHGAFGVMADPNAASFIVRDITPPNSMAMERVDRRQKMLSTIDALQRPSSVQPKAFEALDEHYSTAFNMITSTDTRKAFRMESEDPRLRDAYGRNTFGQSCLLARRLIESGVRFVTLTDGGWDSHQNNFQYLKNSKVPPVDQALPQLLTDLEDRGLLDTTLVVWMTDFGRTPQVNSASGRDHWASAGFVIMAGAGIPGGSVIGATDAEGGLPIKNEYFSEDVMTTIYHKLGLPTDLHVYAPDGRPVRLVEGQLIREWA
jgi:hypothetical protein